MTLITGLHPRFREQTTWQGLISRSAVGSMLFSIGALLMSAAMVIRGILAQHGPFQGIVLWLFAGGAVVLVLGPIYDLVQNRSAR